MQCILRVIATLALVFSFVTFNAFPGDSLMYHLPFSIRFWQLDSWPDFTGYFEDRYQGFPILWRILLGPGLVLKCPRILFLPNLLALISLCWCARKYLYLSWPSTVLACLCFPVALYGFSSSMQDFFMNATALSGAFALFSANLQLRASEVRQDWLVGLFMLALSANVKHNGFLLSAIILLLALIFSCSTLFLKFLTNPLGRTKLILSRCRRHLLYGVIIAVVLSIIVAQPIANLYRFHNPFFPAAFLVFKGSEGSNISTIPYVPKIPILYNGITFISSALEVDPILRSRPGFLFRRSVHMQNPPESEQQPPDQFGNRWIITGGSNGILYLLIVFGALLTMFRYQRARVSEMDSRDRTLMVIHSRLIISLAFTILLPQTLELRYYMYNLFVPCFVAVSSPWRDLRGLLSFLTVSGTAFALLSTVAAPVYFWLRTNIWQHDIISWDPLHGLPPKQVCIQNQLSLASSASHPIKMDIVQAKTAVLCGF